MKSKMLPLIILISISLFLFTCDGPEDEDLTAPDTPTNFVVIAASSYDGEIVLSWSANSEDDLAGYVIYRNTVGADAAFDSLGLISKDSTSYLDFGLDYATTYHYKLRAFDIEGNQSDFSTIVSHKSVNWTDPDPVQNLIIHAHNLSGDVNIDLRWNPNTETDISHYIVFRIEEGSESVPIDTTTITESKDRDIIVGTTYSYMVRAYDKGEFESNPSEVVSDTPLPQPTLTSPVTTGIPVSLTPQFQWTSVGSEATLYRIQVRRDALSDNLWSETFPAGEATSFLETYAGTALEPSTDYIWFISVYSGDPDDVNVRSEVKSFRTTSM